MVQPVRPWANPTRTGPRRDGQAWWSPPARADRAAWLAACAEAEASPDLEGEAPPSAARRAPASEQPVRLAHADLIETIEEVNAAVVVHVDFPGRTRRAPGLDHYADLRDVVERARPYRPSGPAPTTR
jgi:hypothetical protein